MTNRILIIEDDPDIQDYLDDGLSTEGFCVIRADSISKALQLVQSSPMDAILSDYQLGDGTAFDLLSWVKARDIRIPVTNLAHLPLRCSITFSGCIGFAINSKSYPLR